jgi:hypothetical protein
VVPGSEGRVMDRWRSVVCDGSVWMVYYKWRLNIWCRVLSEEVFGFLQAHILILSLAVPILQFPLFPVGFFASSVPRTF